MQGFWILENVPWELSIIFKTSRYLGDIFGSLGRLLVLGKVLFTQKISDLWEYSDFLGELRALQSPFSYYTFCALSFIVSFYFVKMVGSSSPDRLCQLDFLQGWWKAEPLWLFKYTIFYWTEWFSSKTTDVSKAVQDMELPEQSALLSQISLFLLVVWRSLHHSLVPCHLSPRFPCLVAYSHRVFINLLNAIPSSGPALALIYNDLPLAKLENLTNSICTVVPGTLHFPELGKLSQGIFLALAAHCTW